MARAALKHLGFEAQLFKLRDQTFANGIESIDVVCAAVDGNDVHPELLRLFA